jgi:hypothetical protein
VRTSSGRNGEAGGHRHAEIGHLGEVRALSAEQVTHGGITFGPSVAEKINPLCHARFRIGREAADA